MSVYRLLQRDYRALLTIMYKEVHVRLYGVVLDASVDVRSNRYRCASHGALLSAKLLFKKKPQCHPFTVYIQLMDGIYSSNGSSME